MATIARMADGPGKYDAEAEQVLARVDADGVVLLVMGGTKGNGFAVKGTWEAMATMPEILRNAARWIERDLTRGPDAPGRHMRPKARG
jgi:hypothetical protein